MDATIDLNKQAQPYFIFQRLYLEQPRIFFNFKIDQGFKYVLKRLYIKSPEKVEMFRDNFDEGFDIAEPVRIELLDNAKNKTRQSEPIPVNLISSPNNCNVIQYFATHDISTAEKNYNFSASPVKKSCLLDYEYVNGDIIQIRITGTPISQYFIIHNYLAIDIVLHGYYTFDEKAMV